MLCKSYSPVLKVFEFGEGALVNKSLDEGLVLLLRAITYVHTCRLALLHILLHKLLNVRLEARQWNTRHLAKLQLLASGFEAMQKIKNTFFNLQLTLETSYNLCNCTCQVASPFAFTNNYIICVTTGKGKKKKHH